MKDIFNQGIILSVVSFGLGIVCAMHAPEYKADTHFDPDQVAHTKELIERTRDGWWVPKYLRDEAYNQLMQLPIDVRVEAHKQLGH